jgi:peptidyl-prolyl cis-trans isomerase SurA
LKKILIIIITLLTCYSLYSQGEGDRIIAIVGNDIIVQSELNFHLYSYLTQNKLQELNNEIIQTVFQSLIADKLILAKAEQDSIVVTSDEVNKQVEARIKEMVNQFGSEKNVEETYGLTIPKIKSYLKDQIERNAKISRVKQKKFGYGVNVTKPEVIKFFNEFKDSLSLVPETYVLSYITRIPKITEDAKFTAREKAQKILDSIKSGIDFSELAKRNSDDSLSAIQGGNLGKVKKGSFVKEFEDAAFLLKPGEVSDLVETEFGYHIIKLLDRTGDFITTQHILVQFPRLETADFTEINFLKDLKQKIQSGELTFKQAAALYSHDQKSASDSGYIGKVSVTNLELTEYDAIKDLESGQISEPVKVGDSRFYGYYIFLVEDKIKEHPATLESDYPLIQQLAQKYKEQKLLNEWLEELKKTIYVEIKL